jgi:hypothetical protein
VLLKLAQTKILEDRKIKEHFEKIGELIEESKASH